MLTRFCLLNSNSKNKWKLLLKWLQLIWFRHLAGSGNMMLHTVCYTEPSEKSVEPVWKKKVLSSWWDKPSANVSGSIDKTHSHTAQDCRGSAEYWHVFPAVMVTRRGWHHKHTHSFNVHNKGNPLNPAWWLVCSSGQVECTPICSQSNSLASLAACVMCGGCVAATLGSCLLHSSVYMESAF